MTFAWQAKESIRWPLLKLSFQDKLEYVEQSEWTWVFLQYWKTNRRLWNVAKPHSGERVKFFFNPGGIFVLSTRFPQFTIQQWLMLPRRNEEVKKNTICIFQYNVFTKGVDRTDQHLSYYSLLRKTVRLPKKVAFWLINCALFNSFRNYEKLNAPLTLILRRSRTGTVWFYTSTSNKRAARPKLYTESLTRDLKSMYSRLTLVRISVKL